MTFENLLIVKDTTTHKEYGLHYRIAEVDEWIKYGRERVKIAQGGGEAKDEIGEALVKLNIDYAEEVIEGVREGDFEFSSDPESEKYNPEWKAILKKRYYYLLLELVDYAFRGGAVSEKN